MEAVIVIEPGEQGGYVVDFPLLPGCCSQGDSVEEALNNISEAIAGCLKSRLARVVRENRDRLARPLEPVSLPVFSHV